MNKATGARALSEQVQVHVGSNLSPAKAVGASEKAISGKRGRLTRPGRGCMHRIGIGKWANFETRGPRVEGELAGIL